MAKLGFQSKVFDSDSTSVHTCHPSLRLGSEPHLINMRTQLSIGILCIFCFLSLGFAKKKRSTVPNLENVAQNFVGPSFASELANVGGSLAHIGESRKNFTQTSIATMQKLSSLRIDISPLLSCMYIRMTCPPQCLQRN
jgi:hypothetical protein